MAIGGTLNALFAGQPLVIVGVTGPVVIFCATLYDISVLLELNYLGWLFWVSFWTSLMHILLATLNMCSLIRFVTTFSGDIFGFLIGFIYIYEGIHNFIKLGEEAPTNASGTMSILLGLGHFWLATTLGSARTWFVLPKFARSILADYGPSISLALFTAFQFIPKQSTGLATLSVHSTFEPTTARDWLIISRINAVPVWAVFVAIFPAMVLTSLLFFDHNISAMLSQEKRFGLKKPPSYNWDFALLGLSIMVTRILGLPPNYGLIPQAPLHVRSLAKIKEVKKGTMVEEVWISVCENRVSPLGQSLLTFALLSSPLLVLIGNIPKGVLAGLFLYLGVAGMKGNSIYDRLTYLCMDEGSKADVRTPCAKLPIATVVKFTLAQVLVVACIFAITLTPAGIVFPILICLLVPLRLWWLTNFFEAAEIQAFDPLESEEEQKKHVVELERERHEAEEKEAATASAVAMAEGNSEAVELTHVATVATKPKYESLNLNGFDR